MCSCDEGAVCAAHRGARHDPAYFDPQSEVARPEEAAAESLARPSYACQVDESAGLTEFVQ